MFTKTVFLILFSNFYTGLNYLIGTTPPIDPFFLLSLMATFRSSFYLV